ncbi:hypothetical protein K457DRAFT_131510 [Linnemannia elongata AG-77]|uniref:Uncharacterized protein n=1 Tax=Linnemannia elongata AG-77 TaxID=1314771 RepID=A0A197JC64_9FUNG|nr:hypothetical protein K457DRAFT_131510 [Linnemannia elongata AG-77]
MEETQSFCLNGMTKIEKIPIQHVDGQNVIHWKDIEQVFPGVKYVKNGDVAIPCYVKCFPGVVLNVVLSSDTEHVYVDPPLRVPSMVPTMALHSALTVDRANARADHPSDPSSEDKLVEDLRVTSALAEMPIEDIGTYNSSTGPSNLPPRSPPKRL